MEANLPVLVIFLFAVATVVSIYSLFISLRNYIPQMRELLNNETWRSEVSEFSYAVWPTRLRMNAAAITGVPQVLFRRNPKPFARKVSWRSAGKGAPPVTRRLSYAAAPDQVFVLA
jgi:hypothetical protein